MTRTSTKLPDRSIVVGITLYQEHMRMIEQMQEETGENRSAFLQRLIQQEYQRMNGRVKSVILNETVPVNTQTVNK